MTLPTNLLDVCREYLEKSYLNRLNIRFSSSISDLVSGRQPVWRIVSAEDLTSEVPAETRRAAGLLLDPEIGLLFYMVPFNTDSNLRKQIVRALALRSQLSVERNYTGELTADSDARGAWRVVMNWVIDADSKQKWVTDITDVRRETAFSEELSMDAIFLEDGDLESQLVEHGLPRLLLTTREVFKKQRLDEMLRWMSADDLVARTVERLPASFRKSEQRELADEIVRVMKDFQGRPTHNGVSEPPETPATLRSIRIHNFRNLRDVALDFGLSPVSARVVHGPNGTGKSSLCEALSLSLFHSSFRYKTFSNRLLERDVTATDRAADYLATYLRPIEDESAEPKIALDGERFESPHLVSAEKVQEADIAMSGTILTQDMSLGFAQMSSDELGARVLRGYSDLADHIEYFTESRVAQANSERQDFLRGLGVSAAITRIDTAYARIAKREVDQFLPAFPFALVSWLETVSKLKVEGVSDLPERWRAWGDDSSRDDLAEEIASANSEPAAIQRAIGRWLETFNELALRTEEHIGLIETKISPIRATLDNVREQLTAWGEWLARPRSRITGNASAEVEKHVKKVRTLQSKQQQLVEKGQSASGRVEHLTRVEAYIRENWGKSHADECPTCGTDQAERGGILSVIESLRASTAAERDRFREEYLRLKNQLEETQRRLADLGQEQCPLTEEAQSLLTEALRWLLPDKVKFGEWITVKEQRDELIVVVNAFRQMPASLAPIEANSEAERVANAVFSKLRSADRIFEAPSRWNPVRDKLTKTLGEIVNEHLPNTLAKLWCEVALNLTAAPWLLPDRPSIEVVTRRGQQRSTIRVKGRLARYLLNQSEIHILGLAWFFTRYLTHSRFYHATMVMDDPAHELDQTSFRDLCRLWETFARLHRVYQRPLKLVIMLNQESRAVEAARATGGVLTVLGWALEQDEPAEARTVIGEGFFAPLPAKLFQTEGSIHAESSG
jgi:hypothetical protein